MYMDNFAYLYTINGSDKNFQMHCTCIFFSRQYIKMHLILDRYPAN